jgi:hypothetical protein
LREYFKGRGRAWLRVFFEISYGLPIIARKRIPFIRYSKICGIYTDDDLLMDYLDDNDINDNNPD